MTTFTAMPKYEAYKDSGVDWIGDIPVDWDIKKLSHLFSNIGSGTTPATGNISFYDGNIPWLQTGDLTDGVINSTSKTISERALKTHSALKQYKAGSLVVAMYGATIGKVGLLSISTATNQACCVLEKTDFVDMRFAFYLFMGFKSNIVAMGYGGGQPNISQDLIRNLRFPFPNQQLQTAIANFLDEKTAKIDEAIAIKEKQIELLKERKQIIIQQAVTQGLDPAVPMKDSGVEWIGQIPVHWGIENSKWLFSLRREKAKKDDVQLTASQKYGVIPQQLFMELEGRRVTQVEFNSEILKHVESGDFVISMRSFQGGIEYCSYIGSVSSAYVALIPTDKIHPTFFKYLLKCNHYIEALQSTSNLVRDGQALRYENFCMVPLPVVPIKEQIAIAEYINQQISKIESTIDIIDNQVIKLKEYKTTLINSAVTGKIKVV